MTPMPWQGMYVGGHAGGAWGLNTDADYSDLADRPVSDIRLKRDIALVGRRDDGLGLYRYRYLWSDTVYVGVMAQEVALIRPDAIVRDALDDYLKVDYGRLGMKLMTLPEWDAKNKGASLLFLIAALRRIAARRSFCLPITLQCMSLLLADSVAKVRNCRATFFPPEDQTSRNRQLMWPQARYRSHR